MLAVLGGGGGCCCDKPVALLSGAGGGYNEREGVEYKERDESDDEYDEVSHSAPPLPLLHCIYLSSLCPFSLYLPWPPSLLPVSLPPFLSGDSYCPSPSPSPPHPQFGRKKKKFRGKVTQHNGSKPQTTITRDVRIHKTLLHAFSTA